MAAKKKKVAYARCYDCKFAYLMGQDNDPVIARCNLSWERNVASTMRKCEGHVPSLAKKIIHPMINFGDDKKP
jgi:hypothetical protein